MKIFSALKPLFKLVIVFFAVPVIILQSTFAQSAYRGIILDQFLFQIGEVDPGDVIQRSFTITHDFQPLDDGSARIVTVFPVGRDFSQNEDGTPYILSPEESESLPIRASDWLTFERESFLLNVQEQKQTLNYTITVPQDAVPGSKYVAVCILNRDGDIEISEIQTQQSGLGLNAAGCVLNFFTVRGDLNTEIEPVGVYTANVWYDKQNLFFTDMPPVNVIVTLKNTGTTFVQPRGRVYIHTGDNYVNTALASFELNETKSMMLPGSTRSYTYTWDDSFISAVKRLDENGQEVKDSSGRAQYDTTYNFNKLGNFRLGNFRVTVQYDYTDESGVAATPLAMSTSFIIFPWQLVVLILVLITIISLYVRSKVKNGQNTKKSKR